jgi:hypothetical protein
MYIVSGTTLLTDFHILDDAYSVDERIATKVTGITVSGVVCHSGLPVQYHLFNTINVCDYC